VLGLQTLRRLDINTDQQGTTLELIRHEQQAALHILLLKSTRCLISGDCQNEASHQHYRPTYCMYAVTAEEIGLF
jgi:hypothetical protein